MNGVSLDYPTSPGTMGAGSFILKDSLMKEAEKDQDPYYLALSTPLEWHCPFTNRMWLLSTWIVANVTEELNI